MKKSIKEFIPSLSPATHLDSAKILISEKLNAQEKEIKKLQAALDKANEVVDFYAECSNWEWDIFLPHDNDRELMINTHGYTARQAKKEITEILKGE